MREVSGTVVPPPPDPDPFCAHPMSCNAITQTNSTRSSQLAPAFICVFLNDASEVQMRNQHLRRFPAKCFIQSFRTKRDRANRRDQQQTSHNENYTLDRTCRPSWRVTSTYFDGYVLLLRILDSVSL